MLEGIFIMQKAIDDRAKSNDDNKNGYNTNDDNKNDDNKNDDNTNDDNKNDDNKKPQWEFPEDGLMNLCRTCNMAWMKDDKNPSCKCTPLAPFDFRELCANVEPTVLKQIQG